MKTAILTAVAVAMAAVGVDAGCQNIAGNYYCSQVNQVIYGQVGSSGQYNKVTSFNDDGSCSSSSQQYSGPLAPFNEELSVHFRGPIQLKQFGVYYKNNNTGSSNQKRESEEEESEALDLGIEGDGSHHKHKRVYVTDYVYYTKTVVAGQESSAPAPPPSTQQPPPASSAPPAPASSAAGPAIQANAPAPSSAPASSSAPAPSSSQAPASSAPASSSAAASSSAPSSSGSSSGGSGDWQQDSYYNSGSNTGNNLVFMNNQGGSGSGVWSSQFGNSISFAGSDGTSCASSPQVLSDTTIGSNKEFMIFSGAECSGQNGDCGYYRPGIPAYKGFSGDTKLFVFEFSMPHDSSASGFNADMPAVWFLNAQIPRTLQYGNPSCSCWSSGCGELDVFEVLNSGNNFLTSHIHSNQGSSNNYGGGGTPDYFSRPTSGTLRAAVIFNGDTQDVTITQISGDGDFEQSYSDSDIQGWIQSQSQASTNFKLSL